MTKAPFLDLTYARDASDSDNFKFTTTPTPGEANTINLYDSAAHLARLSTQNDLGVDFFGMNADGTKPSSAMEDVLDLHITMDAEKEATMWDEQSYEMYHSVESFRVGEDVELSSGGRIRPRGQSTLAIATCMAMKTIPFLVDFTSKDNTQTLFGVEKLYLRHHMSDASYSREWTMHRLLARSGLPHLRTRTVRLYINDVLIGLYEAMEAPDQEYVFARSFPSYNKDDFALFKIKTHAAGCGLPDAGYTTEGIAAANEVPPYTFERGNHREKIEVDPSGDIWTCIFQFFGNMGKERVGVYSAYKAYGGDCSEMLVEEGIIDQDLGSDNWKAAVKTFYNAHMPPNFECEDLECSTSTLKDEVNVENFLKNFAWYGVTLGQDSPMGNLNNWYLANPNDGTGWNIVQYDHNNMLESGGLNLCQDDCLTQQITWSINRPTCRSLNSNPIVGPLLSDPNLHAQYLVYVKDILDNLLTDALFTEISEHITALKPHILGDPFGWGVDPDGEASTTPADANCGATGSCPFLPALKLRRDEIYKQLTALNASTFPRATEDLFNEGETCADWESTTKKAVANLCTDCAEAEICYNSLGCLYRDREDGTWSGLLKDCDPVNGICDVCFPDSTCLIEEGGEDSDDEADKVNIVISEVSSNPVEGTCNGQDYIELFNPSGFKVYLADPDRVLILHDDRGHRDSSAFEFPALSSIDADGVLLLCANGNGVNSPSFGIKDNDAISVYDLTNHKPVTTAGRMRGTRGEGESWTLQSDGTYAYNAATPFAFRDYQSPPNMDGTDSFNLNGSSATRKVGSENVVIKLAVGLSLISAMTVIF
ncbi:hypothetical protein TrRE_jg5281 [Triparma retinervis]|uniref:Uncharacterized protein n=1 Tax=Triparma retinervis TaxID=2557542 RepID=A0A9W6ZU69_9STRA|nr:hypothetical protein TrRE_jg5281 [Triparma retinervis]